jgi:hypothetical protein
MTEGKSSSRTAIEVFCRVKPSKKASDCVQAFQPSRFSPAQR